jgi:hypothetical protein
MSKTTKNTAPAAPSLADLPPIPPHTRKARALMALADHEELTTSRLSTLSGTAHTAGQTSYRAQVLDPMEHAGLISSRLRTSGSVWRLTPEGRATARQLLDAVQDTTQHHAAVALPRGIAYSTEPPPPDTYRCPRAGAYDFERCPSRIGNQLRYRDGRRVEEPA